MTLITRESVIGGLTPDLSNDSEVEAIASRFEIPIPTAIKWERELGGLETLTQTVGANAPDQERYLTLLRRREWLPYEREAILRSRIIPAYKWLSDKTEKFIAEYNDNGRLEIRNDEGTWCYSTTTRLEGSIPGFYAEHHQNNPEKQERVAFLKRLERITSIVREYTRRYDSEWISLAREEHSVRRELTSLYRDVAGHPAEVDIKKDLVKRLKEDFPYLRLDNSFTSHIADCTTNYAGRITYSPGRGAESRRAPPALKREVRDRDDGECVVCGAEGTVVHHVIPHGQGGPHEKENLALLCNRHHEYAHGRGRMQADGSYDTVEYDSRQEFWNDWIDADFDDYELWRERRASDQDSGDPGEQSTLSHF